MNGSVKYSDLGTTATANPVAVVAAIDDVDDADAGVLLVATPVIPVVATTSTERVEVIAPASLPGGYELDCDYKGRSVVVRVVRNCGGLVAVERVSFVSVV